MEIGRVEGEVAKKKARQIRREKEEHLGEAFDVGSIQTHHPIIDDYGLFADHDMACAVIGCKNPAVYDMPAMVFQPCWKHQREGYKLLKPDQRRWRKGGKS